MSNLFKERMYRKGMVVTTGLSDEDLGQRMMRAGNCTCQECGKLYSEHPYVEESWFEDHFFLHILCDETIVKL